MAKIIIFAYSFILPTSVDFDSASIWRELYNYARSYYAFSLTYIFAVLSRFGRCGVSGRSVVDRSVWKYWTVNVHTDSFTEPKLNIISFIQRYLFIQTVFRLNLFSAGDQHKLLNSQRPPSSIRYLCLKFTINGN